MFTDFHAAMITMRRQRAPRYLIFFFRHDILRFRRFHMLMRQDAISMPLLFCVSCRHFRCRAHCQLLFMLIRFDIAFIRFHAAIMMLMFIRRS